MNKRSIVFDNNVLISAALLPTSLPAKAYRFGRDNCIIKYSSVTLVELEDVLFRKKFDKYISFSEKNDFINFFLQFAVLVSIHTVITDCRDPKDNKFLELAIDGHADYIVTGDKDLLVLHPYHDISIVNPSAFLEKFALK